MVDSNNELLTVGNIWILHVHVFFMSNKTKLIFCCNVDYIAITLQPTRVLPFESLRKVEPKQSVLLHLPPLATLVKWTEPTIQYVCCLIKNKLNFNFQWATSLLSRIKSWYLGHFCWLLYLFLYRKKSLAPL